MKYEKGSLLIKSKVFSLSCTVQFLIKQEPQQTKVAMWTNTVSWQRTNQHCEHNTKEISNWLNRKYHTYSNCPNHSSVDETDLNSGFSVTKNKPYCKIYKLLRACSCTFVYFTFHFYIHFMENTIRFSENETVTTNTTLKFSARA